MSKRAVYEDVEVTAGISPVVPMPLNEVLRIVLIGVGVGAAVAVLYALLDSFVFSAVLCRPQYAGECAQAPDYAMIVAMVIGAIGGLVALARARVYRPLLIVITATITLWLGSGLVAGFAWYWTMLILAILYAIAYVLFAWIARIRSFVLAVIASVVAAVLVRWIAML